MPSPTHTREMSINSKIYKINKFNILPLKISERPKQPHTPQRGSPPSETLKRPPDRQEGARKKLADNGPKSGPHHKANASACMVGDEGKSKIHPSPHPQPKGTIQRMTAQANPRPLSPPTHNNPHSKTPTQD